MWRLENRLVPRQWESTSPAADDTTKEKGGKGLEPGTAAAAKYAACSLIESCSLLVNPAASLLSAGLGGAPYARASPA